MATSVAAGFIEAVKGGAASAARAWPAQALAASFTAQLIDARYGTLQKSPLPYCYADLVAPFSAPIFVQVPNATGGSASPVQASLQK